MKVNIANASRYFFSGSSLTSVYFEAIANALDAGANKIEIDITIEEFQKPETLAITIKDDGEGFKEKNFEKFSTLLEIEEKDHKGLGRLVYLRYFNEIEVNSLFDGSSRHFIFSGDFEGKSDISTNSKGSSGTVLEFSGYNKDKVKEYDYLKPSSLKRAILHEFFPLLHGKKIRNTDFGITIRLTVGKANQLHGFSSDVQTIDKTDIPELLASELNLPKELSLYDKVSLYHAVLQDEDTPSIIIAINVDGRAKSLGILETRDIPSGYTVIFVLHSDYFIGKVDGSRQNLTLEEADMKMIKQALKQKIGSILLQEIPVIHERNTAVIDELDRKFPHLNGLIETKEIGLINKAEALRKAHDRFFLQQKELLEADTLSDEQYKQSLHVSSRLLLEYILYRQKIIQKLKSFDHNKSEYDIHDLIIPRHTTSRPEDFDETLFTNNAWLLDDKYMSFSVILSDQRMAQLMTELEIDEDDLKNDNKKPDIALVFSKDPETNKKVDVVVVELKKLGVDEHEQAKAIGQLRQRARKLLKYYGTKIQRIWFYGIVELTPDFEIRLEEDDFTPLFSHDKVFYKEQKTIVQDNGNKYQVPTGIFVLSHDAFLNDAETRNETFFKILKNGIKKSREEQNS